MRQTHGSRSGGKQDGYALLIVLWTLVGLSILVSYVIATAGSDLRETRLLDRTARMRSLAEGGIWGALFHESGPPARRWSLDGLPHTRRVDDLTMTLRLRSEAGMINPNIAPRPLLAALLRHCGATTDQADHIANNIILWRSPPQNDSGETRGRFFADGRDYLPPHSPFQSITELALVPGMTSGLFQAARTHLSITQFQQTRIEKADAVVQAALNDTKMQYTAPIITQIGQVYSLVVDVDVEDGQGGRSRMQAVVLLKGSQSNGNISPASVRIVAITDGSDDNSESGDTVSSAFPSIESR